MGEPNRALIAAKLPLAGDHRLGSGGHVTAGQADRAHAEARTEGDQRCLRSHHNTQPETGQRGQQDPGQFGWGGRRTTGVEAVRGRMAAATGQAGDGESYEHSGDQQRGQRPPQRRCAGCWGRARRRAARGAAGARACQGGSCSTWLIGVHDEQEQPVHGRLVEGEFAVEHPWAWRSRTSPPRSHPGAQVSW